MPTPICGCPWTKSLWSCPKSHRYLRNERSLSKQLIPHVGGNFKILPIREDAWTHGKTSGLPGAPAGSARIWGRASYLEGYRNIRCFSRLQRCTTPGDMSRLIDLAVQEAKQLDIEDRYDFGRAGAIKGGVALTNEYGAPLDRNGYAPSILQDDDSYCLHLLRKRL